MGSCRDCSWVPRGSHNFILWELVSFANICDMNIMEWSGGADKKISVSCPSSTKDRKLGFYFLVIRDMRDIKFLFWNKLDNAFVKADWFNGNYSINEMFTDLDKYNIIPFQFTWLLDKNGNEIYEWHIVRLNWFIWYWQKSAIDCEVNFHNGGFYIYNGEEYILISEFIYARNSKHEEYKNNCEILWHKKEFSLSPIDDEYPICEEKTLSERLNETHHWIECTYCNWTWKSKSITWWCFFCNHPMIQNRKPWFRWVKI